MHKYNIRISINLLINIPNQASKFRTENLVEINDDPRGIYNTNSQIKFKASMLKSNLCGCSDAYILVKGKITVEGAGGDALARKRDERGKEAVSKNVHHSLTA